VGFDFHTGARAEAIALKKDEPKIRDLAETFIAAERQNDVAAAKELLAEDVVVKMPEQEALGKDAAAARLQEAIRAPITGPANDWPLRFEELETIGDWAYFRLRFFSGSSSGHVYLRSIAHKERNGRWRLKRISLARAA
jgi:ketosteroid isomerase-like protein